ncbi:MAG: helix-turn-helix domain-containing protein [Lachnotalea sp.]
MAFSEIVKCIRGQLGITQEQLAHELNVSFSTINRWENGHRVPQKLAMVCLIEFCKHNAIDMNIIAELEKL